MIEYFGRVVLWWMLTIVKFLFTPFAMIFNQGPEHWTWLETVIVTSTGAALGVFIFFHGGEYIFNWWAKHFGKKKVFSPMKRRIIRIKWKYGIKGLMLISGIISVPIASMIAAKFYRHNSNSLPLMIIGFLCWSLVLTSVAYFFRLLNT